MNNKFNSQLSIVVILLDLITIAASYAFANMIRFNNFFNDASVNGDGKIIWVVLFAYIIITIISQNNEIFMHMSYRRGIYKILEKHFYIIVFTLIYMYVTKSSELYSRVQFVLFFVIDVLLMMLVHCLFKYFVTRHFRHTSYCERVMLITYADDAEAVLDRIRQTRNWHFRIKVIAVLDKDMKGQKIRGIEVVADASNYYDVIKDNAIDAVIINTVPYMYKYIENVVSQFLDMGIIVHLNLPEYDLPVASGRKFDNLGMLGVITYKKQDYTFWQIATKRTMDIIGGIIGMFFFGIAMLIFGPIIKLDSKGPVLFVQTRIGKNGRKFNMYKFRSMCVDAEDRKTELMNRNEMTGPIFKIKDDPRITRVGKFLRKTSIDELPQFINVLKGDMSLVGTRPPTEEEYRSYNSDQRRRMSIKPGITGVWQVSGRNSIANFDDIVRMDCEYIDTWSISRDIKILLKTIWVVIFGKGAE